MSVKEESIKCFLSFATIPLLKALLFPAAFIFSWPFSFHFERLDRENIKELKSGVLGVGGKGVENWLTDAQRLQL